MKRVRNFCTGQRCKSVAVLLSCRHRLRIAFAVVANTEDSTDIRILCD
jgi:hypothetical protein